jgi:RimJ/RimL family protein N-acetyltransferase
VYELGIEFYAASRRGQGLGTETLAPFIPPLFESGGAIRLKGHTHVENASMIRLFDRFRFKQEGILLTTGQSQDARDQ